MIVPVQYLRGIAALMVVYHHVQFQLIKAGSSLALPLAGTGAAGVDIFFIISGFIIWITTRSPQMTPREFLTRRLIRIVPLYWAVTLLLLAVSVALPNLLGATAFNPGHAALSLLFLPTAHPRLEGEILPFFIQGWTLNYEMLFYGLFTLAMAIKRERTFAITAAVLCTIVIVGQVWTPSNTVARFYATTLLLEFLAGMALGRLYLAWPQIPGALAWAMLALGSAGLAIAGSLGIGFGPSGFDPSRALFWGLPGLAIVAGAVYLAEPQRKPDPGPFLALGEASYSLYLTHLITLPVIALAWRAAGLGFDGTGGVGYALAALLVSALAGWLSFVWLERPMTPVLRRQLSRQSAGAEPASRRRPAGREPAMPEFARRFGNALLARR